MGTRAPLKWVLFLLCQTQPLITHWQQEVSNDCQRMTRSPFAVFSHCVSNATGRKERNCNGFIHWQLVPASSCLCDLLLIQCVWWTIGGQGVPECPRHPKARHPSCLITVGTRSGRVTSWRRLILGGGENSHKARLSNRSYQSFPTKDRWLEGICCHRHKTVIWKTVRTFYDHPTWVPKLNTKHPPDNVFCLH